MPDESSPVDPNRRSQEQARESEQLKEGEDYYFEGPYMVFTERYHLKRGVCCHSGCRHCPYKEHSA
jgi:hypothetical protein